jgi:hypothetical protein
MPPLTIRFDDETEARLRREAEAASVTVSDLVRQLVVASLDRLPRKLTPYESWQKHFANLPAEEPDCDPDLADKNEEALREIFDEKLRRLG